MVCGRTRYIVKIYKNELSPIIDALRFIKTEKLRKEMRAKYIEILFLTTQIRFTNTISYL